METPNRYAFSPFSSIFFALASFALCLAAEFNKSKRDDLILDGKLCSLPQTAAFQLGIAALICLSITQVAGSLFIFCSVTKSTVSRSLLVLSWVGFGVAVILLSAASSMNQSQAFGEGWLDGECYLVKDGVYIGSAILTLLALGSTLGSSIIAVRRKEAEENTGVLSSGKC